MDKRTIKFFWLYVDGLKEAYKKGSISKEDVRRRLEEWKRYGIDDSLIEMVLKGLDYYVSLSKG